MTQPDLPMDFPAVFDLDVERADCPWPQPEPFQWPTCQPAQVSKLTRVLEWIDVYGDFWILCVALPVVLAILAWSLA